MSSTIAGRDDSAQCSGNTRPGTLAHRIESLDLREAGQSLDAHGFAPLPAVLTAGECEELVALHADDARFRSRIQMERLRFGVGEYKYFAAPLPPIVQLLRTGLYAHFAPVANRWAARLKPPATNEPPAADEPRVPDATRRDAPSRRARLQPSVYPATLEAFLATCHAAGQRRPTPLLLSYRAGGYNCLHHDIYGDVAFPLQVVFVLSRLDEEYTGGELLLIEQRPRAQSRGHAVAIPQGAGVVFATRERPVAGVHGDHRVVMRHGVSTITSGARTSLGVIFHDAT